MNILSLNEFLKLFSNNKNKDVTFTQFMKMAQVKVGDNLRPLKEYAKDKHIELADLKLLFENILNRNEYLTRFYNLSLMLRPIHITISPMKNKEMDNNHETLFKNIIRNIHFRDILQKTKSGTQNNLYNNYFCIGLIPHYHLYPR